MNDSDIAVLNRRFGALGRVAIRSGEAGFPVVSLVNRAGACEVSLYGGHVLGYRPMGHGPVLFVSQRSLFESGKPIRGGIPICWPWFGPNPGDKTLPIHGFARINHWELLATEYTDAVTEMRLSLADSDLTRHLWPYAFGLSLRIWLDDKLNLALTTENRDTRPFAITQGFHPYFRVRDIANASVHGLEGAPFLDRLTGRGGVQDGPLVVGAETERLYTPTEPRCALLDAGLKRMIALAFSGTDKLVAWNPWIDKARAMADFGDDEYARMLCLEPVNAGSAAVTLAPGERQTLTLSIQATLT